jgi:uncharacterized protein YjbI with pentapeptide repeats
LLSGRRLFRDTDFRDTDFRDTDFRDTDFRDTDRITPRRGFA